MPRLRPLSEDDKAAWEAFVLGARRPAARAAPPAPPAQAARKPARSAPAPLTIGEAPAGLDAGTWHRFRSGRMAPERRLDLHGKTVAAAHLALTRFLHAAQAEQVRCVEVITGKGSPEGGGAIRRELPMWLNEPGLRGIVLATAHPHARNPGATRVLLRRRR